MNFEQATDKQLIDSIVKGSAEAYEVFQKRYIKRLRSVFYKKFQPLEKSLSYSLGSLFEDFRSIVYTEVLSKPLQDLRFDVNGSIGGFVHKIANDRSNDMWERTINHRSSESTEKRKLKKAAEKENGSDIDPEENEKEEKFDYGFGVFEESEVDKYLVDSPEGIKLAETLQESLAASLTEVQWKIVEMKALKNTQDDMAKELGLTKDQIRTQIQKINNIVEELKSL